MAPLRLIFAGSGGFGVPTFQALLDAGHQLVQVFTQPDRPAGRGRSLTPTPIGQQALERNVPLVRTANINDEPLPEGIDAMVVIAFGQKISEAVANQPRLGSVNLHSSRLPMYRGAAPINWAILRGESVTGNSAIRLANRMDAGAILGRSLLPIGELETAGELHDRLATDGAPLVLKVLENLADGRAVQVEQDDSMATSAPKLTRESTRLDWTRPARDLAFQIRGLYPWPGCRVSLLETDGVMRARITLVRARAIEAEHQEPGRITAAGYISTGDGVLEVVEVQPEGKRSMSLSSFRNGYSWNAGMRLESLIA